MKCREIAAMYYKFCTGMKKKGKLEQEILVRGYYGIGNWLRQHWFEEALAMDDDAMGEVQSLVGKYYDLLTNKLFKGVETKKLEFVELPHICAFAEKECPYDVEEKQDWAMFAQEIIYGKLSLAEQATCPIEFPSWCDMFAEFVLMLVGQKCAADERFQDLDLLKKLMDEELFAWEFFRGFTLSGKVLKDAEQNLEIDPQDILGSCRMIEMAHDTYDLSGQTQEQILKDLWHYEQSGGCVEFPEIVVAVARGYRDTEMDDAYIALWKKLAHPILQYGILIYTGEMPDECLTLLDVMKKHGMDEMGLTLVRDYWFSESVHTMEKLLQFEQNKDTKDTVLAEIMPVAEKVRAEFEDGLKGASQKLLDYFTAENLMQWAFAMNTLGDKPDSIYKKAFLTVLNTLKGVLDEVASVDVFSTDTKDLQYLLYLAKKTIESQNDDKCKQLEKVILNVIDSGKFRWFGGMNQDVLNQMVVLASLLHINHTPDKLLEIVKMRLVKYEGWNVTPIDRVVDQTYASAYLMGSALLVEYDETYFKTLVGWAVDQANNVRIPSDALLAPLYVAELVVANCKEEWRDWYERMIISELESFEMVVKVLILAKTGMPDETKTMFNERKEAEWYFVKQQYHTTKRQLEWKNIEKMMKELLEKAQKI